MGENLGENKILLTFVSINITVMKILTKISPIGKSRSIYYRISFGAFEMSDEGKKYRQIDYYTGLTTKPERWNKKTRQTTDNSYINGLLQKGIVIITEIGSRLLFESALTYENFRAALQTDVRLNEMFRSEKKIKSEYLPPFEFIETFINKSVVSEGTKKDYQNTLMHLKDFDKFRGKSISWKGIGYEYYLDLVEYLKTTKHLKTSTIDKIVKNLKVFLSQADLMDNIEVNQDFKKTVSGKSLFGKVGKEETEHVYLTEIEIKQITDAVMPDNRLSEIRDLFIIECWTGLRVSDLSRLERDNIKNGLLSITTKKTRQRVVIPVTDELQAVLNKYPERLPKIPTDQHYNRELKKVCEYAGINEPVLSEVKKGNLTVTAHVPKYRVITSHTARRSFATNLYRRGIPSTQLMFLTGHKTETSFLKYIKVSKEDNAKDVAKKLKKIG